MGHGSFICDSSIWDMTHLYETDLHVHRWYCCCSVLQCVAVRCGVLRCVAVCCSVLQFVAVYCACGNVRCVFLVGDSIHFFDKNHSCGTWLIHMGHDFFNCDSSIWGTCLIHMGHDSFICDSFMWGVCLIHMGLDSFICDSSIWGAYLIQMGHDSSYVTHLYWGHVSFMCDMTHSYVTNLYACQMTCTQVICPFSHIHETHSWTYVWHNSFTHIRCPCQIYVWMSLVTHI